MLSFPHLEYRIVWILMSKAKTELFIPLDFEFSLNLWKYLYHRRAENKLI